MSDIILEDHPLVSCILATKNRPAFLRQALRLFSAQTYCSREMVVVDDGDVSAAPFCENLPNVRHIFLPKASLLGDKLNLGIEKACGDIIHKWDDDDYYSAGFLETAVGSLLSDEEEHAVVAWARFLIYLAGDDRLRDSGSGYAAGGTLCFRRSVWKRAAFQSRPQAVDTWFLRDNDPHLILVDLPELYVLVRHGKNTWTKMQSMEVDECLRRCPPYARDLHAVLDPESVRFLRSLTPLVASPNLG